jgi:hypothetical protein
MLRQIFLEQRHMKTQCNQLVLNPDPGMSLHFVNVPFYGHQNSKAKSPYQQSKA